MKFKDLRNVKLIFRLLTICAVLVISFSFASVAFADASYNVDIDSELVLSDAVGSYKFGIEDPVMFYASGAHLGYTINFDPSQYSTGTIFTFTRDKVNDNTAVSSPNNISISSSHFSIISGGKTWGSGSSIGFDLDSYVLQVLYDRAYEDGTTSARLLVANAVYQNINRLTTVQYTISTSAPQISFGNGVGASTEFDIPSTSASSVNVPAGYTAVFYRPSGNIGSFSAKLSASDFYPKPGFSDYVNGVTIYDTMEPQYLQGAYPINQVIWNTNFAGKSGTYTYLTQNSTAPFVQLVNPLFSQNGDLSKPNPTVKVEYPAGFVVKLFALTYNDDRSSEVTSSSVAVNYVPENMTFEDPSTGGLVNNPSTGGNSEDLIYDGGETDNLLQNLSNLFTPGINAVSELVSRATGFFTALGSMFSWLPDEVFTVVISALSILIIVGAIKLFL